MPGSFTIGSSPGPYFIIAGSNTHHRADAGAKVRASWILWDDDSGNLLREWMRVDYTTF